MLTSVTSWFNETHDRNKVLYYFGWICLWLSLVGWLLVATNSVDWVRPARFLFTTTLFVWTTAWLLYYLHTKRVAVFSVILVIILSLENAYNIVYALQMTSAKQAFSSGADAILQQLRSAGILAISLYMAYFCFLFFLHPPTELKRHYLWGVRFGMLYFVIFSLTGNLLAALPGWDAVANDGISGLRPVGATRDSMALSIAHFFGLHALQVLPLFGRYISTRSIITILFSIVYFLAVVAIIAQALLQQPLIELYMG